MFRATICVGQVNACMVFESSHLRSCVETATSLIEAAENTEVWRWVANSPLLEKLKNTLGSVNASTPAFLNDLLLANDVASVRTHQGKEQFVNTTTAMSSILDPLLLSLDQQCKKTAQMH